MTRILGHVAMAVDRPESVTKYKLFCGKQVTVGGRVYTGASEEVTKALKVHEAELPERSTAEYVKEVLPRGRTPHSDNNGTWTSPIDRVMLRSVELSTLSVGISTGGNIRSTVVIALSAAIVPKASAGHRIVGASLSRIVISKEQEPLFKEVSSAVQVINVFPTGKTV